MSKEKTPFEKTAAALKVMGKKIAAKILLMAMPLNFSKERISVVPSKDDVEAFFKPSKFYQIEMNFDEKGESENEEHADD